MIHVALRVDPGLLVDPGEGPRADVRQRRLHRHDEVAKRLEGRDTALRQGTALARGDARYEAEVIVGAPPCDAFGRPATDVAVLDWLRVRPNRRERGRRRIRERGQEPLASAAVIGHEVVDAEPFDGACAPAERDVHPLRPDALEPLELVHVGADLEDGARLDVTGQLRVGHFVVPGSPAGRPVRRLDPEQEIRVAAERAVEERGLVDDVRAGGHRLDRLLGSGTEIAPRSAKDPSTGS